MLKKIDYEKYFFKARETSGVQSGTTALISPTDCLRPANVANNSVLNAATASKCTHDLFTEFVSGRRN